MCSTRTLILALASAIATARAYDMTLNTWVSNNCEGGYSLLTLENGSGSYCFQGVHGNSIGGAQSNIEDCFVTTWSGTNCQGSSAGFPAYDLGDCQAIPFGSVELSC